MCPWIRVPVQPGPRRIGDATQALVGRNLAARCDNSVTTLMARDLAPDPPRSTGGRGDSQMGFREGGKVT